eukprot:524522-Alexandrium_andersonii.AAC.1
MASSCARERERERENKRRQAVQVEGNNLWWIRSAEPGVRTRTYSNLNGLGSSPGTVRSAPRSGVGLRIGKLMDS